MSVLDELLSLLAGTSRAIVVAEKEVDLRPTSDDNRLFVLQIGEGSLAAGGRGGGFGERKVTGAFCFELRDGAWSKTFEERGPRAESFEVPYYVSRLPMTMDDGTESMGYGVVERELLLAMMTRAGISSA